ncbi:hypothetical protein BDQ17DRAFT_1546843 [Cyathus striatus]|nr:hypothetical protein BDQ17DRAFT_1546843 [Cyathus striatus]
MDILHISMSGEVRLHSLSATARRQSPMKPTRLAITATSVSVPYMLRTTNPPTSSSMCGISHLNTRLRLSNEEAIQEYRFIHPSERSCVPSYKVARFWIPDFNQLFLSSDTVLLAVFWGFVKTFLWKPCIGSWLTYLFGMPQVPVPSTADVAFVSSGGMGLSNSQDEDI